MLRHFLDSLKFNGEVWETDDAAYWVSQGVPAHDFNRQVIVPGASESYPQGAVMIMSDCNFWEVAALPLSFKDSSLESLVGEIWPEIERPTLLPDDGDIYWAAICDDSMEVPGEPWELWATEGSEETRLRTGRTRHEMEVAEQVGVVGSATPVTLEIRCWDSGARRTVTGDNSEG